MARILVVDNDPSVISVLQTLLKAEGFDVQAATNGDDAHRLFQEQTFELMICDIRMDPVDGMQVLTWARQEKPDMCVIMLTAFSTVETAVDAMKLGAFEYIKKPFKVDELLLIVQRALEYSRTMAENSALKAQVQTRYRFEHIVAESRAMKHLCEMIERIAPTDQTVLICGESGTGKELVAKAIHCYSRRRAHPFIAINCAALPEALLESEMFGHAKGAFTGASAEKIGLFEAATDGTILLDEISSMPLGIQGKLLRALQEGEIRRLGETKNIAVHPRILAATNVELEALTASGAFREDLYFRLSVIPLTITPLRQRREDILPLVFHVLKEETPQGTPLPDIEPQVMNILESYAWPGNVRELISAVKHALTFAANRVLKPEHLPARILESVKSGDSLHAAGMDLENFRCMPLKSFLQQREADYIQQVIDACDGDKDRAAKALSISLATLYRKLG